MIPSAQRGRLYPLWARSGISLRFASTPAVPTKLTSVFGLIYSADRKDRRWYIRWNNREAVRLTRHGKASSR